MRRSVARFALLTAVTAALATAVAVSVAVAGPAPTTFASLTCSTNVFDNLSFATPAAARGGEREPSAWKNPPIDEAPTLDPGEAWSYNPDVDHYASEPYQTTKTRKVLKNHVKAEATKESL